VKSSSDGGQSVVVEALCRLSRRPSSELFPIIVGLSPYNSDGQLWMVVASLMSSPGSVPIAIFNTGLFPEPFTSSPSS
jgi:hypothetical protein